MAETHLTTEQRQRLGLFWAGFTADEINGEEWRSVVGWDGFYEVSDIGRVRRIRPARGTQAGHVLIPRKGPYPSIILADAASRIWRNARIHRLVAFAFLGQPKPGQREVNHKDTDKWNNRVSNLEWVTSKQNHEHAARMGCYQTGANHYLVRRPELRRNGERNPMAVLTEPQVIEVIRRLKEGSRQATIASEFGVAQATIYMIKTGKTWTHLPR